MTIDAAPGSPAPDPADTRPEPAPGDAAETGAGGFPFADATRERSASDGIPLAHYPSRRDVGGPRKSLDITRVRRDGPRRFW